MTSRITAQRTRGQLTRKLSTTVTRSLDATINGSAFLATALVALTGLLTIAEIIMRYFFRRPIPGAIELSEYGLLFITFLAAPWVLKRDAHVTMDLAINHLTPRARLFLNMVTSIVCLLICSILFWHGAKSAWYYVQISYRLPTPMMPPAAPLLLIIPVGFLLLFAQFIRRTLGYIQQWGMPDASDRRE